MKKILIFIVMLLSLVPLFSVDTTDPLEYKKDDAANTQTFDVIFDGAEWSEIGFSSISTGFSKGSGVTKSTFSNNAITMVKYTTSGASDDTYDYKVDGDIYIYWYVSIKQAMNLVLKVEPNSVTSGETTTYDKNTVEVEVTGGSYSNGKYTSAGSATTITGSSGSAEGTVVTFPKSYAVYQGDIKLTSVTAKVKAFPTNRVIGKLTLILRTAS